MAEEEAEKWFEELLMQMLRRERAESLPEDLTPGEVRTEAPYADDSI